MECRDIKGLLSEYIDQVLDKKTYDLVQGHLLSCKKCSQDLDLLKTAANEIKSLKEIKAPDDFLINVHQRIERRSEFEKIVNKFLASPKIRIPAEALGALVTVIFVIAVFRFMHPDGRPTYYPRIHEEMITQPASPIKYPEPKDLFKPKKSMPVLVDKQQAVYSGVVASEQKKIASVNGVTLGTSQGSRELKAAKGKYYLGQSKGASKLNEIAKYESINRSVVTGLDSQPALSDTESLSVGRKDLRAYDESLVDRGAIVKKEPVSDKKPEVLLTINSSKLTLSECVSKIRTIVESRSGTIQSVEIDGSGVKNIVSIKIPTMTYARFIKELSQMGTVQVGIFSVKIQEKYLFLKVEIAVSQ